MEGYTCGKIKTGDNVVVLTGKDKGRTGKVTKVLPTTNRVLVQGVNMVQRHTRPSQTSNGGIIEKDRRPRPPVVLFPAFLLQLVVQRPSRLRRRLSHAVAPIPRR